MSPESLQELRVIFKANKSPSEKRPGTLSGCVGHGRLSREGTQVAFLKGGKNGTLKHDRNLKGLRKMGTAGKARWLEGGLASVP